MKSTANIIEVKIIPRQTLLRGGNMATPEEDRSFAYPS
jgi:hypothetical protein